MLRTVLILIVTLIVLPVVTFYVDDTQMTADQKSVLMESLYICIGFASGTFIISTLTRNYSQVDKIWSIAPLVYAWHIAWRGDWDPRLVLMAILVSLWGLRLSYNFSRRGGYSWKFWEGEEDYRWAVLRQKPEFSGKWAWLAFNLFFISGYQCFLIWLFTMPIMVAYQGLGTPLMWLDFLAAALILALIVMETVADQQQWNYQKEKYRRKNAGEPLEGMYAKGFTHTGLWKISRHPNYFAEQSIWVVFYFFSVAATGLWINWSMAGCLLLLILFKGSADFSEGISKEKYPEYAEYIRKTGRFIPKLF